MREGLDTVVLGSDLDGMTDSLATHVSGDGCGADLCLNRWRQMSKVVPIQSQLEIERDGESASMVERRKPVVATVTGFTHSGVSPLSDNIVARFILTTL